MLKKAFSGDAGLLAAVILLAAVFFSFGTKNAQASDAQVLNGHVPPVIARFHLQPLQDLPSADQLSLAVSLPLRNAQGLDNFLQQLYDPASPEFHHYLTPEQFTAQFGPSQQDYEAVVAFLKTNGLTVITHSDRTLVDASGDAATINRAFHLTLQVYQHPTENRTFYAPDTDPVITPGVPISHITGLDNFLIPRPLAKIMRWDGNRSGAQPANGTGSGTNGEYMGKDFRAAYAPGVTLNGAGQSVALFELDAYYSNDIAAYEQLAGLASITLTNVPVNGGVTNPGSGDGEVSLDIEMAISMATNLSKVIVYEAPNGKANSIVDLLSRIASDNLAKQISSSWLVGDSSSYDTYYKKMAALGQSFFQASGDDGAFYSGISEWADDTNITLVGGTTLSTTGPTGAWSSETVWNWYSQGIGTGVGGGGVNFNNVPIPAWQQGISMASNQGSTTLRNVPDVALTADDVYVYYNQGNFNANYYFGGTSCAAPLWAGFTALINQQATNFDLAPVGFINPAVYAIGKSANYTNDFHDITTGNNTNTTVGNEWYAVPGYDLCTGWGTPNGQNLINALAPSPEPLAITPAAGFTASAAEGGPFTVASQNFYLTNTGTASLNWEATASDWLNLSPSSGTLAGGAGTTVTASLDASTASFAVGTYSGQASFTDENSGIVQQRQFSLSIGQNVVQNGGFETGSFSDWTLNEGKGTYSLVDDGATTGISPHSGTYLAALGYPSGLGTLSQTLTTTANQSYLLSLWLNSPNVTELSVNTGLSSNTPNQFTVSWNGTTLFNQTNIPPLNGWTNLQFIVTATGSSTVLQFGERVDPWYFGLDDVNAWPIPSPTIRHVLPATNHALSLTWNSLTNVVYEVEYSTNLSPPNWFILSTNIATSATLSVTNPIGTNQSMFYRVLRLP